MAKKRNTKIKDELFNKEVPKGSFEAIFNRLDVDQFFNMLSNLWEPSELIRKMGGLHNLEKLYKDDEIYAAVDKRIAALLDTNLTLEGNNTELVKFFEDQLIPHEYQLKQDFWWAVPYGYSVEQIIYHPDRSGKVIGFQKEEFHRFEPQSDLIHIKLVDTTNNEWRNKILPYGKWVLTTNNGSYYNPFGDLMFERLIMPWIFKCNGWDLWIDFAKRFANGFMHGKVEDAGQITEFRKVLEKAAKSSTVVTDKNTELSLIQASRDSSIYDMLDSKTVAKIQKVILGETLTSDMQARGSSGATSVHNLVREEKTKADIRLVEKSFNNVIEQIAAVNGITDELPKAKLIFDPSLNAELASRDSTLSGAGVKFTKKYFINKYGFKDDEFEITDNSQQQSWFSDKSQKKSFLKKDDIKSFLGVTHECKECSSVKLDANTTRKDNRQLNEKEELVDLLHRNGEQPISVDDVIAAITTSKNEKDLDDKLSALFDNRNNGFADIMTDALYASATKGALFGNPKKLSKDEIND